MVAIMFINPRRACADSTWSYYGSHLVMVGWVASLVVAADGAASTELSSLSCKLFYLYMTCMCFYVLYVCVFVMCTSSCE